MSKKDFKFVTFGNNPKDDDGQSELVLTFSKDDELVDFKFTKTDVFLIKTYIENWLKQH